MTVQVNGWKLRLSCPHQERGLCPRCAAAAVRRAMALERRRALQVLGELLQEVPLGPEGRFALAEAQARLEVEGGP